MDFSDRVAAHKRSYRTRSQRQRRGTTSDDDESEVEETLAGKLARLRREAEEIRQELERREREEGEFHEAVEEQEGGDADLTDGIDQLSVVLDQLRTSSSRQPGSAQTRLGPKLSSNREAAKASATDQATKTDGQPTSAEQSTLSQIASFSDRLGALEAVLGLPSQPSSSFSPASDQPSILPSLASLSAKIECLGATLTPVRPTTSTGTAVSLTSSFSTLDALASRIHALTAESERLTAARKAALQSLQDLHDARIRQTEQSLPTTTYLDRIRAHRRAPSPPRPASSSTGAGQSQPAAAAEGRSGSNDAAIQPATSEPSLYLAEQTSKITALYTTLPTIQSLSPLLPTVLQRLRSLAAIHSGAATARTELDELARRQSENADAIRRWRDGVDGVEKRIREVEETWRNNETVVARAVAEAESRVEALEKALVDRSAA